MGAVYWKELADYCGSWRFLGLVIVICLVSLFVAYVASETVRDSIATNPTEAQFLRVFTAEGKSLPSFLWFVSLFGPLIGIIFGFDAVNSERNRGTLSRVLSQPIYRDAVINGKFLAGFTVIAIMTAGIFLMVSALAVRQFGITPDSAEMARLLCFYLVTVIYLAFWLGLGMLCSVFFRQPAVSALVPIAIWLFVTFFISMIATFAAETQHPVSQYSTLDEWREHDNVELTVKRVSPVNLYYEGSEFVLDPSRRSLESFGVVMAELTDPQSYGVFGYTTVSLGQSLKLIWPHLVVLIGLTGICFAASYIRFVKEEIRAT